MSRPLSLIALLLVLAPATSSAQPAPAVRLSVDIDTWLPDTPIDLRGELAKKLVAAGVEVTDRADVEEIVFVYDEVPMVGIPPLRITATSIEFRVEFRGKDGVPGGGLSKSPVPAVLAIRGVEFPTPAALREKTIESFWKDWMVEPFGDLMAARLGVESGFRRLLSRPENPFGRLNAEFSVFHHLRWTAENDDLFEMAIAQ